MYCNVTYKRPIKMLKFSNVVCFIFNQIDLKKKQLTIRESYSIVKIIKQSYT